MATNTYLFSFRFSTLSLKETILHIVKMAVSKKSAYVCVSNVHMVVEATKDAAFTPILQNADLAVLDGMPLVWSMKLLNGIKAERIAGMHLMDGILQEARVNKDLAIYLYGSKTAVLKTAKQYILNNYRNVKIVGYHAPPYIALTASEELKVIEKINSTGANLIFVALGCPKQEKWMANMKGKIPAVMVGIGIALEVLTRQQARTPLWMEASGLEWFFRLLKEPRRLFKRYLITNSYYLLLFLKTLSRKVAKRFN